MAKTASSLTATTSSRLAAARPSAPHLSGAHTLAMLRERGLTAPLLDAGTRPSSARTSPAASARTVAGATAKRSRPAMTSLTCNCKTSQVQLHPRAADAALRPLCSVPSKPSAAAQPSVAQPSAARTSVAHGRAPSLLVLLPGDADRAPDARSSPDADAAELHAADAADEPRRTAFHAYDAD